LIEKDSPTQIVIGEVKEGFSEVVHDVPMLSLQDVFTKEAIYEFAGKIAENFNNEKIGYTVETKIDGLSVSLEYKKSEIYKIIDKIDYNKKIDQQIKDAILLLG
jgi:DNA ligase (NAD+)